MGYGEFVFSEQKGGLACCWSIKNPEVTETVNQTFYLVKRKKYALPSSDFIDVLTSRQNVLNGTSWSVKHGGQSYRRSRSIFLVSGC